MVSRDFMKGYFSGVIPACVFYTALIFCGGSKLAGEADIEFTNREAKTARVMYDIKKKLANGNAAEAEQRIDVALKGIEQSMQKDSAVSADTWILSFWPGARENLTTRINEAREEIRGYLEP